MQVTSIDLSFGGNLIAANIQAIIQAYGAIPLTPAPASPAPVSPLPLAAGIGPQAVTVAANNHIIVTVNPTEAARSLKRYAALLNNTYLNFTLPPLNATAGARHSIHSAIWCFDVDSRSRSDAAVDLIHLCTAFCYPSPLHFLLDVGFLLPSLVLDWRKLIC